MTSLDDGGDLRPQAHLRVSWKFVAVLSQLTAASLLIALVVAVSTSSAEALSTSALVLAVLAFGAQLIVYVAQVADSSASQLRSSSLHALTQSALERITAKVENSDFLLREQRTLTLDAMRNAKARSGENDRPFDAGDVIRAVEKSFDTEPETDSSEDSTDDEDQDWISDPEIYELRSWPTAPDEIHSSIQKLEALHPISAGQLARYAEDWITSRTLKSKPGLTFVDPAESPFTAELLEAGLVERTGRHPRGRPPKNAPRPELVAISHDGRLVARLLMAYGTAPEEIRQVIHPRES